MECNPSSSCRVDRRTIEKNRRTHMKALYSELHSIVPHESSRVYSLSLPPTLLSPSQYIKKLLILIFSHTKN
ncbi:putative transcription factor bHLH family [Helianthus annuus]|nr:putative transcription factor bHLH family [Helianthus annuus]KAJ0633390.1 putative transcription factor bHLH family [Helianthus annuus]